MDNSLPVKDMEDEGKGDVVDDVLAAALDDDVADVAPGSDLARIEG
jgi:hypothetical protein|tara:strand:+ start:759 stop:896 length:138 start_codon:yes stop_codon:yes gene_type:complete